MKSFLFQLVLFLSLLSVLLGSVFLVTKKLVSNNRSYYTIAPDKRYVILGHSIPSCAFNDSLIDHCINLSDSREGYYYTAIKLRKLLEANKQIQAVFIEVTNNQFTEFANSRIYGEYAPVLIPKYLSCMNAPEAKALFKKNPGAMIKAMPLVIKTNLEFIFSSQRSFIRFSDWGRSEHLTNSLRPAQADSLVMPPKNTAVIRYNYLISEMNLWWLGNLVRLAEEKNVRVFFIRSPILAGSRSTNEGLFRDILTNEFAAVPFLDFGDFPLPAGDFADVIHLNHKGAKKISLVFNRLLKSGILELPEKQELINEKIKLLSQPQASVEPADL